MKKNSLKVLKGRSSHSEMFCKISQNLQESTCAGASFLIKTLAQMISGEFYEIFKNTYFVEHLRTAGF